MGGLRPQISQNRSPRRELFVGAGPALTRLLQELPLIHGAPVRVEWRTFLRNSRGRLEDGPGPGTPVHAASYPRRRLLVLDNSLRRHGDERRRIFVHELFHFVWPRLGNSARLEWEALLANEWNARIRGELGWSAELRKQKLTPDDLRNRTRRWREYLCENFCDSAAWCWSGVAVHEEFTLPRHARPPRRRWLHALRRHHPGGFRI